MSDAYRFEGGGDAEGRGGRFRFRSDLRIVRENLDGGERATVRVIDPGTGKQYSFSEDEYFLCQAADGTNTLRSIQELYKERFGREHTLRELVSFYRRLRILGLLERPGAPEGGGFGGRAAIESRLGAAAEDPGPRSRARRQRPTRRPMGFGLFDPTRLLGVIYVALFPLKYLHWLIWPGLLLAGTALFYRWGDFASDFIRITSSFSMIASLIVGMFTVNLLARLAQGTVICRSGGAVRRLGVTFLLGFIPRFYIDRSGIGSLERRGQLWAHAAPLLTRLGLFVVGTLVWTIYRRSGTSISDAALIVGQMGFWAFALTAMPVLPADGYHWIATYFNQPKLRERSQLILKAKLFRRPLPPSVSEGDVLGLVLFGAATILASAVFALGFLLYIGVALEERFQGAGVFMFLGVFCLFVVWLLAIRMNVKRLRRAAGAGGAAGAAGGGQLELRSGSVAIVGTVDYVQGRELEAAGADQLLAHETLDVRRRGGGAVRVIWVAIIAAAVAVAFLPYRYEAGGEFRVLPTQRSQVTARTDGEITAIHVREGDWVEEGQVLAELSSWDEERDLAVTKAELDRALAELARLVEGPKAEAVGLAKKQVESARARVIFSKAEAERAATLYRSGTVSTQAWEKAKTAYDENVANLDVAIANLDLVKSGATENEIEAARAEVRRLRYEYGFRRDELARTRVRAPTSGRILTPNVHLLGGKYLSTGEALLELEDTRVVQIEIDVPETDIGEVELGAPVRVKAWGYSDQMVMGVLSSIAPSADSREYGKIVRVNAEIPNPDGFLKSEMTGYAKIEGPQVRVWEAYSRLFVRFFQVEVWSWIP